MLDRLQGEPRWVTYCVSPVWPPKETGAAPEHQNGKPDLIERGHRIGLQSLQPRVSRRLRVCTQGVSIVVGPMAGRREGDFQSRRHHQRHHHQRHHQRQLWLGALGLVVGFACWTNVQGGLILLGLPTLSTTTDEAAPGFDRGADLLPTQAGRQAIPTLNATLIGALSGTTTPPPPPSTTAAATAAAAAAAATAAAAAATTPPRKIGHVPKEEYLHQSSYDKIMVWEVPPHIQNFDYIPYRQFCRWRNGKISKKKWIHKTENWTQVWPPIDTNPEPWKVYSNLTTTTNANASANTKANPTPKWLLHIQFNCYETMRRSPFGTGNWVQMIYLLRLGVAATTQNGPIRMDLKITCSDAEQDHGDSPMALAHSLVMPWLTGHFSSYQTLRFLRLAYWNESKSSDPPMVVNQHCMETGWGETPVGWMIPFVRQDLRRMAVALVGLPHHDPHHPAHEWHRRHLRHKSTSKPIDTLPDALESDMVRWDGPSTPESVTPLLPGIELDEAVVHFRCGDVMVSKHGLFRFLKFQEFGQRIFNHTRSIGIVTQSFGGNPNSWWTPPSSSPAFSTSLASELQSNQSILPFHQLQDDQQRERDHLDGYRVGICRAVTHKFVDYLKERFPQARVRIRNGPNETIALAYARLVMAKQAFAYPDSSFSVFPTMASFGIGYNMAPTKSLYTRHNPKNLWILDISDALSRVDAAREYVDGRTELLQVPTKQALYAAQTLQLRKANETEAPYQIVQWFSNDTYELHPDPQAVRKFVEHHDRSFLNKRAREKQAPAAVARMGEADAVAPRKVGTKPRKHNKLKKH